MSVTIQHRTDVTYYVSPDVVDGQQVEVAASLPVTPCAPPLRVYERERISMFSIKVYKDAIS